METKEFKFKWTWQLILVVASQFIGMAYSFILQDFWWIVIHGLLLMVFLKIMEHIQKINFNIEKMKNYSNIMLLTLDNNISKTKDTIDVMKVLSENPNDITVINTVFNGNVTHIHCDTFDGIYALCTTHFYILDADKEISRKLDIISKDRKLKGALQISFQVIAFNNEGINIDTHDEFLIALCVKNLTGCYNVNIDYSTENMNKILDGILSTE